jgi:hypothetical protein
MRVSYSPTIGYGASSAVLGLSTAHTQGGGGALDFFLHFCSSALSLSLSLVVMWSVVCTTRARVARRDVVAIEECKGRNRAGIIACFTSIRCAALFVCMCEPCFDEFNTKYACLLHLPLDVSSVGNSG